MTQISLKEVRRQLEKETRLSILQTLYRGTKKCWEQEARMDAYCRTSDSEKILPFLEATKALLETEETATEGKYDPMLFWLIITTIEEKRKPLDMSVPLRVGFFESTQYFIAEEKLAELQSVILRILESKD